MPAQGLLVGLIFSSCLSRPSDPLSEGLVNHVSTLVSFGPRTPGSKGSAGARAYITHELKKCHFEVFSESFLASTPAGPIVMTNLIADGPPANGVVYWDRVLLATHYDTKPGMPPEFQGANDGTSGCAVLLEIASRVASGELNTGPLKLIFFDGEEAFVQYTPTDGLYGSREYVRRGKLNGSLKKDLEMVLVDMVGDRDLHFKKDPNSAVGLVSRIWAQGRKAELGEILSDDDLGILDDHIPFINAGVPACVLIDLDFGPKNSFWHTSEDRVEHVSGDSMAKTLRLLEAYLESGALPLHGGGRGEGG